MKKLCIVKNHSLTTFTFLHRYLANISLKFNIKTINVVKIIGNFDFVWSKDGVYYSYPPKDIVCVHGWKTLHRIKVISSYKVGVDQ